MAEREIKFLLVDDLEENLMALEALLRRKGLKLLKAQSGTEALELLLEHDVALAILDVQMPGMDGFELAELMRGTERTRRVPIIFVTAGAVDTRRRFEGYDKGAVDFLFKPIEPHILQSKAHVFFELYKEKQEVARQRDELQVLADENARLLDETRQRAEALEKFKQELERLVADRTRELRETNDQLNAFCYSIAHDLKAPLRAQSAFASILQEEFQHLLGEKGCDYLRRISNAAERQSRLVQDLLSHMSISRTELPMDSVDLSTIVQQARTDIIMDVQRTGAQFEIGPLRERVMANPSSLHLVVVNLLSNALKFVAPGTKPIVRIWSEVLPAHEKNSREQPNGRFVRVWVQDNGIGIPAEYADKVFGVFERLHTSKHYPGTGIGLAIVKKAVERMGGQVGVASDPGKGSRFWVDLQRSTEK
jgi:two-component system, sensor histidine kinase and response regulator